MTEKRKSEKVERKRSVTYYKCDKCHGRFHEETKVKEDLNLIAFNAEAGIDPIPNNTHDAHTSGIPRNRLQVESDESYLLCDKCTEDAHNYLKDFF